MRGGRALSWRSPGRACASTHFWERIAQVEGRKEDHRSANGQKDIRNQKWVEFWFVWSQLLCG